MNIFLALVIDLAILLIARNPGKPFRKLDLPLKAYAFVGVLMFPICLLTASMITGIKP